MHSERFTKIHCETPQCRTQHKEYTCTICVPLSWIRTWITVIVTVGISLPVIVSSWASKPRWYIWPCSDMRRPTYQSLCWILKLVQFFNSLNAHLLGFLSVTRSSSYSMYLYVAPYQCSTYLNSPNSSNQTAQYTRYAVRACSTTTRLWYSACTWYLANLPVHTLDPMNGILCSKLLVSFKLSVKDD